MSSVRLDLTTSHISCVDIFNAWSSPISSQLSVTISFDYPNFDAMMSTHTTHTSHFFLDVRDEYEKASHDENGDYPVGNNAFLLWNW